MSKSKTTERLLPGKLDLVFSTFIEVTGLITTGATLSRIVTPILACACEILSGKAAFVILGKGKTHVRISYACPTASRRPVVKEEQTRLSGLAERIYKKRGPVMLTRIGSPKQVERLTGFTGNYESMAFLVMALQYQRTRVGTIGVLVPASRDVEEQAMGLFELLGRQAGIAIKNAREFERTQTLSITDGLTGAYNYRFLIHALRKEIGRSQRFREEFSIIMLDVDGLKEYNDYHGHLRGSSVIRSIAHIVSDKLRSIDMLCKYGGDEFVVILPRTSKEGAALAAERIRAGIDQYGFVGQRVTGNITASMGIASFPEDGATVEDLISSADKALYKAKRQGRNLVWLSGKRKPYTPV
jgi:diguanylate cyclase (GGDEF)-like protein